MNWIDRLKAWYWRNWLICRMKRQGIWDKIDTFWIAARDQNGDPKSYMVTRDLHGGTSIYKNGKLMKKRMKWEHKMFLYIALWVSTFAMCEVLQDLAVIENQVAASEVWKNWGNGLMIAVIVMAVFMVTMFGNTKPRVYLWIPIYLMEWWILHDGLLGVKLTGDWFYLGSGKWDTMMLEIFQHGAVLFGVKCLVLFFLVGSYFRLSKDN